jgi:hypothetical protein
MELVNACAWCGIRRARKGRRRRGGVEAADGRGREGAEAEEEKLLELQSSNK